MISLYSYDNKKLVINDSFSELWSIMKFRGKYIQIPDQINDIVKKIPEKITIKGKLHRNKKFYFNQKSCDIILSNFDNEIQLSIDYDYEIEWEIKSKCKICIGFYSPYRKFSSDRLYLNFDKIQNKLTKYKSQTGKILISCHMLTIASDKYHPDTEIILTINPILKSTKNIDNSSYNKLEYCGVKIFDIKKEGVFYRPIIKKEFKKLYNLVKQYYEYTSIKRYSKCILNNLNNLNNLPKEIDYTGMLSKKSYESIFTVTSHIEPASDRIGYYGVIIKRDPTKISNATIYYEFELSNILQTPDVIVMAAYYEGDKGYVLHQIYDKDKQKYVYVMNTHTGPYPSNNNYISGNLELETTAVDITLLIGNSLYGILPTGGRDPNTIVKFTKFEIKYNF